MKGASAVLEIRNVTKQFGGIVAASSVNLDIVDGQIMGLIGPNGAGKTTLFNMISGFIRPDSGEIRFKGRTISRLRVHRICKLGVGRTFQLIKPFLHMTVLENAMVGAYCNTSRVAVAEDRAEQVLELTQLWEKAGDEARSLTLPERKRLEMARALATEPGLLLLDEVMSGLTVQETNDLMSMIRAVRDSGVTILMIEHVMQAVMGLCENVAILHHGEIIARGTPAEMVRDPTVIKAYLGRKYASI